MAQAQSNVIHIVVSAEEKNRFVEAARARKQSESRLGYGLIFQSTKGFVDYSLAGPVLEKEKEARSDSCEDSC